jgi:hypothetical protein
MRERYQEPSFTLMLSGPLIWAAHFAIIYGFTGLVCARPGWARLTIGGWELIPLGVTLVTLVAAAAIVAVLLALSTRVNAGVEASEIPAAPFQRYIAIGGAIISLIAIAWAALPALMITACR